MSRVEYDLPGGTNHTAGKPKWSRRGLDAPARTVTTIMNTRIVGDVMAAGSSYSVPTMAEVRDVPDNGYRVVSTFSGAGGTSTGFRMAGFHVLYAVEFVAAAAKTYRTNWPGVHLDTRDIREVTAEDIRKVIGPGTLDVLEGSPPCDPFSMAGKRDKNWGKVKDYSEERRQRTDDLTFEFVRLVKDIQPRIFVMENVAGLVAGRAKGYYRRIMEALREAGYVVETRLLDAQWLGVPQMRKRVIIIGIRRDEHDAGICHVWPTPLPYRYSLRDAIGVASVTGREPTNTGQHRKFTIDELKAIGSFPPDYELTGTYAQRWERVGQSVPPLMAKAYAECIRGMLG